LPDEVEEAALPATDPVHLPALIRDHFGVSGAEARRLLAQGGVKLDGEVLDGGELDVPAERLEGRVLQLGKRRFKRFRRAPS
jgi:tyrosyl-tRNA synthetase